MLDSSNEKLDDLLKEAFTENYDNLTWVIDRDGVTFIFAPSDIAAYAAGTLEAKISFDKYPDLFTGNYGPAEGTGRGSTIRSKKPFSKEKCVPITPADIPVFRKQETEIGTRISP